MLQEMGVAWPEPLEHVEPVEPVEHVNQHTPPSGSTLPSRPRSIPAASAVHPGDAARPGAGNLAPVAAVHPEPLSRVTPARGAEVLTAPSGLDWAAGMDWSALHSAVAACTRCGLCQARRKTVFGVGHPRAHWMIVGEAPGEQEDRSGEPFVGAAGQLLDRILASVGLSRAPQGEGVEEPLADGNRAALGDPATQVFITNTVKCRPPQNRNPQPEELSACGPVLNRQLALVQPRVVMALGRFAAQQLLGTDEPIGRLRGRVHRWRPPGDGGSGTAAEIPLVVSYHPAYLLRNPIDKAKAWEDWCLALDAVAGGSVGPG